MASAVACRLAECRFRILMTEVSQPQAVRCQVSFCEVVYDGVKTVEGKTVRLVKNPAEFFEAWDNDETELLIDPEATVLAKTIVDALK